MRIETANLNIWRQKGDIPNLPFANIKNSILGKKYNLNIIFCNRDLSQKLNKDYRGKDYPTNILSFPLSDQEGEIYIQLGIARRDAPKHNMNYTQFLHLLLIHGCLHLKGLDHGEEMNGLEDKYLLQNYNKF